MDTTTSPASTTATTATTDPTDHPADAPPKVIWPCVNYRDAHAAIAFLEAAFGFVSTATYTDPDDDRVVHHAELRGPEGGGVMLGTADRPDSEFSRVGVGCGSCYVVTDDPDGVFARATGHGAEVVRGLVDEDYGSRGFTVRDPEGNLWSFGTYRGHP
jgi:uncharacterized glyoxalase superfamily protein PhnB